MERIACVVVLLMSMQPAVQAGLDYIGCFADNAATPAISGKSFNSQELTNQLCVAVCKEYGYKFAGTQNANACFCGNNYDAYGASTTCSSPCTGATDQTCGGSLCNSVYSTGASGTLAPSPAAEYKGCFRDSSSRVLNVVWTYSATSMTNDMCNTICVSQGTRYAATQMGAHCFCGDVYDTLGPSTACTSPCKGNAAQTCGGSQANSVYEVTSHANVPTVLCRCSGDPHCRSFDGKMMHFQGRCEYVLARDECENGVATGNAPNVLVKQVQWDNNRHTSVSWVKKVTVEVYGHSISIDHGREVRLDGVKVHLPAYILGDKIDEPDVIITLKGLLAAIVMPKLGMEVRFDGRHLSQVLVSEQYRGQMCGFCGNFDGNHANDWTVGETCQDVGVPPGSITTNYNIFGSSWLIPDQDNPDERCKCDTTEPDPCPGGDIQTAQNLCNDLYGTTGRFKDCIPLMDAQEVQDELDSCIFDTCALNGEMEALCESAEALAAECRDQHNIRPDWRAPDFCPFDCPDGLTYKSCENPVQPSCAEPNPEQAGDCVETCVCPAGSLLDGELSCTPADQCGCERNGIYYQNGEKTVASDCSETCECQAGTMACVALNCDVNSVCEARDGVQGCYCKDGYSGDGTDCTDINECAQNTDGCSHTCKNLEGSYECTCPNGFQIGADGKTCTDIDECATNNGGCNQNCNNLEGSSECTCNQGYELGGDGKTCTDIDECTQGTSGCSQECQNQPGSFTCACRAGYQLGADGKSCTDIDECAAGTSGCAQVCTNTEGSFLCSCEFGFNLGADGKSCVAAAKKLCQCSGDPHCTSFDGRVMHFQGSCEYVLAQDECQDGVQTGNEPNFVIKQTNWKRNNPAYTVSFVKELRVEIYGHTIFIGQGRAVTVDGVPVNLPAYPLMPDHPKVFLSLVGFYVSLIVPEFGVEVRFDGNHISQVYALDNNMGNVCGLCGNYNGNTQDDWTIGDHCQDLGFVPGTVATNYNVFGNSWLSPDPDHVDEACRCVDAPEDPCPGGDLEGAQTMCDQVYGATGPFQECLVLMDADNIQKNLDSCIFDMCALEGDEREQGLCETAEALSNTCFYEYFVAFTWRSEDFCPIDCPPGRTYKPCAQPNQPSCLIRDPPTSPQCVESCVCEAGTLLDGDNCIPEDQCGCTLNGLTYLEGETVVTTGCTKSCICRAGGNMECEDMSCDANAKCEVRQDARGCHCNAGYTGDGTQCTDIDECAQGDHDCQQKCVNVDGTFECSCNGGYALNADGRTCRDIDECAAGTSGCQQGCENNEGSFTCTCNAGYELAADGSTCEDIDECALGNDDCVQKCVNVDGTFECSCNTGYELAADGKSCTDIDECAAGTSNCPQSCENTEGSFKCACNAGYELDADGNCVDINECKLKLDDCQQRCRNKPGSYKCRCKDGFVLQDDGKSCEKEANPCEAELAQFALNGLPVDPVFDETTCEFELKQCNDVQCWCVKPNGNVKFNSITFPVDEPYECTPPTDCQKIRFEKLFVDPEPTFTPECKDDGTYETMQCNINRECWCVDPNGDKYKGSKEKNVDFVDCSAYEAP